MSTPEDVLASPPHAPAPPPNPASERRPHRRTDYAARAVIWIAFVGALCLLWRVEVSSWFHLGVNLLVCYALVWALVFAVGTAPRREIRVRFALMTTAVAVLLASLEAVAFLGPLDIRLLFPTALTTPHRRNPLNRLDDELLHIRRPYVTVTGTRTRGNLGVIWCLPPSPPSPYRARYDGRGFRNESDLDTADIAVIGDSYIEGADVVTPDLMTSVLARLTGTTVANLGQSGYSPRQELIVLKRYALPLRPRVIVWAFYEGNDLLGIEIYDNLMAGGDPRAPLGPGRFDRSFSKNALMALYGLLSPCQPAPEAQRQFGLVRDSDGRRVRMYFGDPGGAVRPISSQTRTLETLAGILSEAHALTSAHGMQLVVAYIPDAFRVYRSFAEFPLDFQYLDSTLNDLPERLRRIVARISSHIGFIDLTPSLMTEARAGRIVYWPDDTHWTPAGHRVVAEALSRFLKSGLATDATLSDRPVSSVGHRPVLGPHPRPSRP